MPCSVACSFTFPLPATKPKDTTNNRNGHGENLLFFIKKKDDHNRNHLHVDDNYSSSKCNHLPILTKTRALENHAFSLLESCSSFYHLTQIHAHIIRKCIHRSNFVVTKLVSLSFSFGNPSYALLVFDQVRHPNSFLWNALIRGLVSIQAHHDALLFFSRMLHSGSLPNNFTFPFVLKACSKLLALKHGKTLHAHIVKMGRLTSDVYTQTALLDFYGSCTEIAAVHRVFDGMPESDVVCWNAVLASYVRCGLVDLAKEFFEGMPVRNVSSWTAMMGGLVQSGKSIEALQLFRRMQMDGMEPDKMTLVTLLSAISDLGTLHLGKWVHYYVEKNRIKIDAFIGTALIDMYSKCGSIRDAQLVFHAIDLKTISCYNAMIMGLAVHGMGEEAMKEFRDAEQSGIGIDDVTMVAILSACSHSGLVEEGCRYFSLMREVYGIEAKKEHYGCMIDILGRAGRFDEAMKMVESTKMDPLVLRMLASACQIHGNVELGEELSRRMLELDPRNSGLIVLKSNLYAAGERWEEAAALRRSMKDKGIGKIPGCSWIEVNNVIHEFVAGDHSHPCLKEIYSILAELSEKMKTFVA